MKHILCLLAGHVEWKDGQKFVHGQCWRCGEHVFADEGPTGPDLNNRPPQHWHPCTNRRLSPLRK